ncbi:hypothetical protein FSARC_10272 [Fusarium sarcochroum]|uniref:Zn(2)-C6 fungal-type domain-containing protein n=1 Tax=Fusarium sarcochroum TaxID=1208366 RepID=A0A8H4TN86_9HYPO|nr:hypothetical protein FSARC_10272 [Fusarium sarcochroum]
MFKSCDYCRHRKKKCVTLPSASRCSGCEHLDVPCKFTARSPSLKRRGVSQRLAAQVVAADTTTLTTTKTLPRPSGSLAVPAPRLKHGDCQVRLAGQPETPIKHVLHGPTEVGSTSSPGDVSPLVMTRTGEKYWQNVHSFLPFVHPQLLNEAQLRSQSGGQPGHLEHCIHLASHLLSAKHDDDEVCLTVEIEKVLSVFGQGRLSPSEVTGVLLVFDAVEQDVETDADGEGLMLLEILSSALVTHVWRRLVGQPHPPLRLSSDFLHKFITTLDPSGFGHHFTRLSYLAVEFERRCRLLESQGVAPDTQAAWSRLEYDCLLWQVCLPGALLDTRDELPATAQSIVIHCFSSTLLLSLYSYILDRLDTLGALLALKPIPGVLLFMCILARSTFICPRELLDRWAILPDMQAATARIMLRLWHQTGFENCRAIINLWTDSLDRFPELSRHVRNEIGPGPWPIDEIDGYSVFWTFRDLRSLMTKFIFGDCTST